MVLRKLIEFKHKLTNKLMGYKYTIIALVSLMIVLNAFGPYFNNLIDEYLIDESDFGTTENKKSYNEIYLIEKNQGYDIVLDVRSVEEYENSHLEDSINIPHTEILENPNILNLKGIHKNKMILVYCKTGRRASLVVNEMMRLGYDKNSVNYYTGNHESLTSAFL